MGRAPEEPEIVARRGFPDHAELLLQVAPDFIDVVANLRVDLQVALQELGFDRDLELFGDLGEDLGDRAAECHGLAVDQVELDLDAERRPIVSRRT